MITGPESGASPGDHYPSPSLPAPAAAGRGGPGLGPGAGRGLPRSPKLHGAVEQANRTPIDEITDAEPKRAAFQVALRAWETVYNTIRPHQALGYRTPAAYLRSPGVEV